MTVWRLKPGLNLGARCTPPFGAYRLTEWNDRNPNYTYEMVLDIYRAMIQRGEENA